MKRWGGLLQRSADGDCECGHALVHAEIEGRADLSNLQMTPTATIKVRQVSKVENYRISGGFHGNFYVIIEITNFDWV